MHFAGNSPARIWLVGVSLLVFTLLLVGPAIVSAQGGGEGDTTAAGEITDDMVNAISRDLYCPVCENIPLDVCGTEACARWREQVRTLLEEGSTEEEVVQYFVDQFGERVVGVPQDPTLNLLSWAVPAIVILGSLGIGGMAFLRWRSGGESPAAARDEDDVIAGSDDDYRARLERELRMME